MSVEYVKQIFSPWKVCGDAIFTGVSGVVFTSVLLSAITGLQVLLVWPLTQITGNCCLKQVKRYIPLTAWWWPLLLTPSSGSSSLQTTTVNSLHIWQSRRTTYKWYASPAGPMATASTLLLHFFDPAKLWFISLSPF